MNIQTWNEIEGTQNLELLHGEDNALVNGAGVIEIPTYTTYYINGQEIKVRTGTIRISFPHTPIRRTI